MIDGGPGVNVEDVEQLPTPEALAAFPNLTRPSPFRHRARADNLLAFYSFAETVPCSNENHRHQVGVVVRANCGAVVCFGNDCGAELIEDFRRIEDRAKSARTYHTLIVVAQKLTRSLPALIANAKAETMTLKGFREELRRSLPKLAEAMLERRDSPGTSTERGTVRLRKDGRAIRVGDMTDGRVLTITGMEFWARSVSIPHTLFDQLPELTKEVQAWTSKPPNSRRADVVGSLLEQMRQHAEELLRWCAVARTFCTEASLRAAVVAADLQDEVTVGSDGDGVFVAQNCRHGLRMGLNRATAFAA